MHTDADAQNACLHLRWTCGAGRNVLVGIVVCRSGAHAFSGCAYGLLEIAVSSQAVREVVGETAN